MQPRTRRTTDAMQDETTPGEATAGEATADEIMADADVTPGGSRVEADSVRGPWRLVSLVVTQTLLLVAGLAVTGYVLLVLAELMLGAGREVMAFFG